mgnify:CR=1 FL=1|tara:strand:- start:1562 stop:1753 length:192 start_codon:yes stop_codon:yes gene_type:complete
MDNLKIKITDNMEKSDARVLGELNLGDSHCFDDSALNKLCEALLELYPHDPVKLEISYSVANN